MLNTLNASSNVSGIAPVAWLLVLCELTGLNRCAAACLDGCVVAGGITTGGGAIAAGCAPVARLYIDTSSITSLVSPDVATSVKDLRRNSGCLATHSSTLSTI